MTELIILTAFAPLVFLPFPAFRRLTQVWGWTAIAIAAICNGYFIFLHGLEPLLWLPVGSFLSAFFVNIIGQRYRRGLSVLAVLFVSQALMAKNLGYIIILLALADTFLGAELFLSSKIEEKNRAVQSLYQSALSLLPAALGLLLRLDGNELITCVAATAALRLFSWPVSHWVVEMSGNNKMFPTYIGIVSSFALWHVQEFPQPELWAFIWLLLGFFFSFGSRYTEMFGALVLGLLSLSPVYGALAVTLWPLLAHPSYTVFLVALFAGAAGSVLAGACEKILIPEASYAVAGLAGIGLARIFVFASKTLKPVKWYLLVLDIAFSALWVGSLFYFVPIDLPTLTPAGMTFSGTFLLTYLIGLILYSKKPKIFRALPGLSPQVFSRDLFGADFLSEKKGGVINIQQNRFRAVFFEAIESEGYIGLLLGLLGVLLLWGLK